MGGVFRAVKSIGQSIFGGGGSFNHPAQAFLPPAAKKIDPVAAKAVEEAPVLAPEAEAPPSAEETLLKKKKGRYGTILTGGKGALGSPNIEKKSLLGS